MVATMALSLVRPRQAWPSALVGMPSELVTVAFPGNQSAGVCPP
jgi:hypothetical protein